MESLSHGSTVGEVAFFDDERVYPAPGLLFSLQAFDQLEQSILNDVMPHSKLLITAIFISVVQFHCTKSPIFIAPPFHHSTIPPFHHSTTPPFQHSIPAHITGFSVNWPLLR